MFNDLYVERYRPKTLDDIVLSDDEKQFFLSLKDKKEIPHLLFSGSPGTGKTSLSKIIVNDILDCQYLYINASDENGIDTIRTKVIGFAQTRAFDGKLKVVLFDECDALTLDSQKALRSVVEEYATNTRFIFTCNYLFKIIPALQSRCQIINLAPPLEKVFERAVQILKKENIKVEESEKNKLLELIRKNYPDLRRIINDLQRYSYTGSLQIKTNDSQDFVKGIIHKIQNKTNINNVRKWVIENEQCFSGDYHFLLKEMFENIFQSDLSEECKTNNLLLISEHMYKDSIVLDKEINWFSCCLKLHF
jgi:DNA polymerase III delta prime subunit